MYNVERTPWDVDALPCPARPGPALGGWSFAVLGSWGEGVVSLELCFLFPSEKEGVGVILMDTGARTASNHGLHKRHTSQGHTTKKEVQE